MKISEFLTYKQITEDELKQHFTFVKSIDKDLMSHQGCPNCGNEHNCSNLPAAPWRGCIHCWNCDCIMMVYYADRMGGDYTDRVMVYKEY